MLQIIAYEYYPSVAQKFSKKKYAVDGLLLPRMFQWVTNTWSPNRAPYAVEVSEAFGAGAIAVSNMNLFDIITMDIYF